jgi:hypothetical protein
VTKAKAAPKSPQTVVTSFKGFSADWTCRGFQYEIGGHYVGAGKAVLCGEGGFHACEMPLDTWNYYGPATSKFALVEQSGQIARGGQGDDTKIASAEITIKAELKLPEIIKRATEWIMAAAKTNIGTGSYGHAAATGSYGHAAATGYRGHAAATGSYGHAAATGSYGHAAATGYRGHAAATGDSGHAAATGDSGHAAATGDSGHAAATGDRGHAAVKGKNAIAAALGIDGAAVAEEGGAIMLAAYDLDDQWKLVAVFASKVGENGIAAGKAYRLGLDGKPVEVRP